MGDYNKPSYAMLKSKLGRNCKFKLNLTHTSAEQETAWVMVHKPPISPPILTYIRIAYVIPEQTAGLSALLPHHAAWAACPGTFLTGTACPLGAGSSQT
eukprot:1161590-Pelagomonas_calceolata.AAC.7